MNYAGLIMKCDKCGGDVPGWQVGLEFVGGWCTNCKKWAPYPRPYEKPGPENVRPVLQKFAHMMELRLGSEEGYREWTERSDQELSAHLLQRLAQLMIYLDEEDFPLLILETAADVANAAVMLSDPERLRNR